MLYKTELNNIKKPPVRGTNFFETNDLARDIFFLYLNNLSTKYQIKKFHDIYNSYYGG